jgi:enoyl-CoA hydratase/carnithine racemase
VQYLVPAGASIEKAKELAHRIADNTPTTNWMITNVLPRMNDLSHDDALFMEYLNSSAARHPDTLRRLKDFLEKKTIGNG